MCLNIIVIMHIIENEWESWKVHLYVCWNCRSDGLKWLATDNASDNCNCANSSLLTGCNFSFRLHTYFSHITLFTALHGCIISSKIDKEVKNDYLFHALISIERAWFNVVRSVFVFLFLRNFFWFIFYFFLSFWIHWWPGSPFILHSVNSYSSEHFFFYFLRCFFIIFFSWNSFNWFWCCCCRLQHSFVGGSTSSFSISFCFRYFYIIFFGGVQWPWLIYKYISMICTFFRLIHEILWIGSFIFL